MSEDMISEGGPVSEEAWLRQRHRLARAANDANERANNMEQYADDLYAQASSARQSADLLSSEASVAEDRLRRWEEMRP